VTAQGMHEGPAPVYDLDPCEVGKILINGLAASVALGHKKVLHTARDYVVADPGSPAEFIQDLMTGETRVVAAKWFGNLHNAEVHGQMVAFGEPVPWDKDYRP
jgi:hypothetical protein